MDEQPKSSLADRLSSALADSYTLEAEIGRGGMGVVFSARDMKLKRRVAIKVLPPELAFRGEIRTRFLREAETAARLSHPHIVPIHAVGEAESLVYFVMGFVDGESLAARLRRRERLPPEEVRRIMKETADALGLAHAMGVIHRDIKPDNILLEGTRRRVVVTDFGIAKALVAGGVGTLTGTGVVIGTPTYMSPEQAAGEREIDSRSDLYSLGLVAFEMLVGDPPFQAGTVPGILMKQITEPAPDIQRLRPDCPEELGHTIMRCLEKNPDDRWPTADALRRALENRVSVPYRRTAPGSHRTGRPPEPRPSSPPRAPGARPVPARSSRRHEARRASRDQADVSPSDGGEPPLVRRFRSQFATWVTVNGGLMLLNIVTGITSPWFLFVTIPWGIGVASRYGELWSAGYSWRDVVSRPPARDALPPPPGAGGRLAQPAARLPEPKTDEFGKLATQIRQMRGDRAAVAKIVERLAPAERALLPDVQPTVDALLARAEELARTLSQMEGTVDQHTLDRLDERIRALEAQAPDDTDPDVHRRLDLLNRQREMLADLMHRRTKVEAQFESCVLAIQNVRFDLLRLRSAGVGAALGDLTSATQQARALSADVEAAIDAAGEIQQVLGKGTV